MYICTLNLHASHMFKVKSCIHIAKKHNQSCNFCMWIHVKVPASPTDMNNATKFCYKFHRTTHVNVVTDIHPYEPDTSNKRIPLIRKKVTKKRQETKLI